MGVIHSRFLQFGAFVLSCGLTGAHAEKAKIENTLIHQALNEYIKVVEVGQKLGWQNKAWLDRTAFVQLDFADRDYLWKQVNLSGSLLPATVSGTKLLIKSRDRNHRSTKITEIDYRDFHRGIIHVDDKAYSFENFTSIEAMYQTEFMRAFRASGHSAQRDGNYRFKNIVDALSGLNPVNLAHAQSGCTVEDAKMTATTGLAVGSLVEKIGNPISFCRELASSGVMASINAHQADPGQKLQVFGKSIYAGMTWEFSQINEGVRYCRQRLSETKPQDLRSSTQHDK